MCVVITDRAEKCKPATKMEREEGDVFEGEATTAWRGKVCWSGRVEVKGIHIFFPLIYSTYTPTEARVFFKRAVLELYSCPCALPFTYAVDGWRTEPNVST